MRDLTVVKGLKFIVMFQASDSGDVKGATNIAWPAFRDNVIASCFAGLVNLWEEPDVADEVLAIGIGASIRAND